MASSMSMQSTSVYNILYKDSSMLCTAPVLLLIKMSTIRSIDLSERMLGLLVDKLLVSRNLLGFRYNNDPCLLPDFWCIRAHKAYSDSFGYMS